MFHDVFGVMRGAERIFVVLAAGVAELVGVGGFGEKGGGGYLIDGGMGGLGCFWS